MPGTFANNRESVTVTLNGFGAFPPVIYINVLKAQELLTLQTDLIAHLETLGIVDPVSKTRLSLPT